MKNLIVILIGTFLIYSCTSDALPKPKPFLKLKYPVSTYSKIDSNCPYVFEHSSEAEISFKSNCWAIIKYPKLKGSIYITYRKVSNNLNEILKEVEKLTYEHTIKADAITNALPYENNEKRVFAKIFNVEGNVASNVQFVATDSLKHVLAGSLYFYAKPNYDSILPAVKYIEKDLIHLVETLEWK
ncbi:gliding motility lipoprotein GldD [Lutibacter citreus]|uniref:gliding motility lipoprotein GldD n=1 Tax=Lutibacter citreus TaxID=2138210 RepID=UPI000DBE5069|nr:gliding motility lipoprotein GldD [Lutibacter citreus]